MLHAASRRPARDSEARFGLGASRLEWWLVPHRGSTSRPGLAEGARRGSCSTNFMPSLATHSPKDIKAQLGRTATFRTPLSIRSSIAILDGFQDHIRVRLGRALDRFATRIERISVRFENMNGPKGGIDTVCRTRIVISGEAESVIVEQAAEDAATAFALSVPRLIRAMRRTSDKRGGRAPRATFRELSASAEGAKPPAQVETLIGRTAGRSAKNLASALERPEKSRGDIPVDTAEEATSATDRRAGGAHTARRNTKASEDGSTATLEDSLATPSRKSTRRSGDRQKSATPMEKEVRRALNSPQQHPRGAERRAQRVQRAPGKTR
jgi:ribosome-associated translation inhibitor RaiA